MDDERHLWPHWFHLIRAARPPRIYGEQVASKDGLGWLDLVSSDLEGSDYSIWAVDTCSAGSGAPHIRQRLRFCADDLGFAAIPLGHTPMRGEPGGLRERGSTQWGQGATGGHGSVGGLDDGLCEGLEGQRDGHRPSTGQRQGPLRPVTKAGGIEWVADDAGERWNGRQDTAGTAGRHCAETSGAPLGLADNELQQRQVTSGLGDDPRGRHQEPAAASGLRGNSRPGPTNGFWRDADWLFCRDAKWRPVVASHVEMVDGSAANLGRGGTHCQEESQTRLQAMLDTFGEEEIQRQAGRQWALREEGLLRPILHGRLDGRPDQEPDAAEQPQTICEDCGSNVRGVSGHGNLVPCASCGREPAEQRPLELEDVVRQLPQSLSLAELYGRWESARRLRLLQRAINEEGSLLRPPVAGEAAWASLGEDAKGRIRLGFDVGAWRQVVSFPLVSGGDFKPGSGSAFEGKSRQGMLKGYGNAIDAEATIDFIEATLEPDTIEITVGADTGTSIFEDLLG